MRTALVAFGVDASHGLLSESIVHALNSIAELITEYVVSPLEIERDVRDMTPGIKGFPEQPTRSPGGPDGFRPRGPDPRAAAARGLIGPRSARA